jgi:hypothetical protein
MKSIAPALLVVVLILVGAVLVGAGSGKSPNGLRGTVVIYPASPVCQAGSPCTRPAARAPLRFWRNGKVVARTRTDGKGHFRVGLAARKYRVTSKKSVLLTPAHVTVMTDRYRRVTFKLDSGIR